MSRIILSKSQAKWVEKLRKEDVKLKDLIELDEGMEWARPLFEGDKIADRDLAMILYGNAKYIIKPDIRIGNWVTVDKCGTVARVVLIKCSETKEYLESTLSEKDIIVLDRDHGADYNTCRVEYVRKSAVDEFTKERLKRWEESGINKNSYVVIVEDSRVGTISKVKDFYKGDAGLVSLDWDGGNHVLEPDEVRLASEDEIKEVEMWNEKGRYHFQLKKGDILTNGSRLFEFDYVDNGIAYMNKSNDVGDMAEIEDIVSRSNWKIACFVEDRRDK